MVPALIRHMQAFCSQISQSCYRYNKVALTASLSKVKVLVAVLCFLFFMLPSIRHLCRWSLIAFCWNIFLIPAKINFRGKCNRKNLQSRMLTCCTGRVCIRSGDSMELLLYKQLPFKKIISSSTVENRPTLSMINTLLSPCLHIVMRWSYTCIIANIKLMLTNPLVIVLWCCMPDESLCGDANFQIYGTHTHTCTHSYMQTYAHTHLREFNVWTNELSRNGLKS